MTAYAILRRMVLPTSKRRRSRRKQLLKKAYRPSLGSRLLREWRESSGLRQIPAAPLLGLSQGGLSDLETGRRGAGRECSLRIALATAGAVPADSWGKEPSP